MTNRTFVTRVTDQDGSFLAGLLLAKGYEVHGHPRETSTFTTSRIDHNYQDHHESNMRLLLHYGDPINLEQVSHLIYNVRPDEIYHLGAHSHVEVSFDMPEYIGQVSGLSTTRLFEAVRQIGIAGEFYQASFSEMFGNTPPPQNECSAFSPRSPYAAVKEYAHRIVVNYRSGYDTFAVNGILFNHESPRRSETFVARLRSPNG